MKKLNILLVIIYMNVPFVTGKPLDNHVTNRNEGKEENLKEKSRFYAPEALINQAYNSKRSHLTQALKPWSEDQNLYVHHGIDVGVKTLKDDHKKGLPALDISHLPALSVNAEHHGHIDVGRSEEERAAKKEDSTNLDNREDHSKVGTRVSGTVTGQANIHVPQIPIPVLRGHHEREEIAKEEIELDTRRNLGLSGSVGSNVNLPDLPDIQIPDVQLPSAQAHLSHGVNIGKKTIVSGAVKGNTYIEAGIDPRDSRTVTSHLHANAGIGGSNLANLQSEIIARPPLRKKASSDKEDVQDMTVEGNLENELMYGMSAEDNSEDDMVDEHTAEYFYHQHQHQHLSEYAPLVEMALERTGYEMYSDMALINVPLHVIDETYKTTLLMLVESEGGTHDIQDIHSCTEDVILSVMLGGIDYELDYVILHDMVRRMWEVEEAQPRMVEVLGGEGFETAFIMMSEVLTNHMKWAMDATASKMGIRVAREIFMEIREEIMEHPGMELHSLLDIQADLIGRVVDHFTNMLNEYGNCSTGGSAVLAQMLREEAERIVMSEDYQYVVEIILRTTLELPDEAVQMLLQARNNLSEELSEFLLAFTFPLEDANLIEIGEIVVDYAGQIIWQEIDKIKKEGVKFTNDWNFLLRFLDTDYTEDEEYALMELTQDPDMLRFFIRMLGTNMENQMGISEQMMWRLTMATMEKSIHHVEILERANQSWSINASASLGGEIQTTTEPATSSTDGEVHTSMEPASTAEDVVNVVTEKRRLLTSGRGHSHNKRQTEEWSSTDFGLYLETDDWSNWANGSVKPVILNFTDCSLIALEETGNLAYQHLPISNVPEQVFTETYHQGEVVVMRKYVSKMVAMDCMDYMNMNYFMGMLYFRIKYELPEQMEKALHTSLTPADLEKLGGDVVKGAYALMVDVLTSHMLWTLDHLETSVANFHFYDEVLESYTSDIYAPGFESTPFAYAIASFLYESYSFVESVEIDTCPDTNITQMAELLYKEADRIRNNHEYEVLMGTILRLVKQLPNDTVAMLMTYRDVLAEQLASFVESMADLMTTRSETMVYYANEFSIGLMYYRLDEIKLMESNMKKDWDFIWWYMDDQFAKEHVDKLLTIFSSPEHLRFMIEIMISELPEVGITMDKVEDLVRESIEATVRHWHILYDEMEQESEPEDENEMATPEGTTEQDVDSFEPTDSELEAFTELVVLADHLSHGKAVDNLDDVIKEAEGQSRTEAMFFLKQMHALAVKDEDPLGFDGEVWRGFMQEVKDEAELVELHSSANYHLDAEIQTFQIFIQYVQYTEADVKTTYSEIMDNMARVHDLLHIMTDSGPGELDIHDVQAWMDFLTFMQRVVITAQADQLTEELAELAELRANLHGSSHNHLDFPYSPTEEEIQAFMDFLQLLPYIEGGIRTTNSEILHHLAQVHDLVHKMTYSGLEELDQQDIQEWLDFLTFMQSIGVTEHGHQISPDMNPLG